MTHSRRGDSAHRPVRRIVVKRLVRECKIMQSRVEALLRCDAARANLAADDVFGRRYETLLRADVRSLGQVVKLGERDLGEIVHD